MFIMYKDKILTTTDLRAVYFYEAANAIRFGYNNSYETVKCTKKDAPAELNKIFKLLNEKGE